MELRSSEISSLVYHDIFDYPLTLLEIRSWELKSTIKLKRKVSVLKKGNFYFIKGRGEIIEKRLKKEEYSKEKLKIAKKAVLVLSKIPTIKLIALTGALAMNNADNNSDIDFLIVTENNTLWSTRLVSYLILFIFGFKIRKPKDKNQKNKLCLNMWLDENDLVWGKEDRNIYSAHELIQIYSLANENNTYQKLINQNSWVLDYWPNKIKIDRNIKTKSIKKLKKITLIEKLAYKLQYLYMRGKISREVVSETRAIFHPNDWSKVIFQKLLKYT